MRHSVLLSPALYRPRKPSGSSSHSTQGRDAHRSTPDPAVASGETGEGNRRDGRTRCKSRRSPRQHGRYGPSFLRFTHPPPRPSFASPTTCLDGTPYARSPPLSLVSGVDPDTRIPLPWTKGF